MSSPPGRHTCSNGARGRTSPSQRPPPTAVCLPRGRPRRCPGSARPFAPAVTPRWAGSRRPRHPFPRDSFPDAIFFLALGAVHSPWRLHESTTLTTFPCHLPVCRAASRPQGQGVAVRVALSLRAAQRPSARLAGCQPASATFPRRLHSRGLLLHAVRHGRASRSVCCLFQLTLCAGGGGPWPAPVLLASHRHE